MKLYMAAAYGRREEMLGYAAELVARGHEITARWIYGLHETPPDGIVVESTEHHAWCAMDDVEDIAGADAVVSFTGGDTRKRGGRQVEFGIGVALGKAMVLIGEREHVFHHLPSVVHHETWEAFLASDLPFGDGVCNVCGCSDLDCFECVERTGEPCQWVAPGLCSACNGSATPELRIRAELRSGPLTPEKAVRVGNIVVDALNAAADGLAVADGRAPGGVRFHVVGLQWIDDGKDDVVVRLEGGGT